MTKEFTVSQVNGYISGLFVDDYLLNNICVVGEVSNYRDRTYNNGIYFSLKDERSVIECRVFDLDLTPLPVGFSDGSKVRICGKIKVYEAAGKYQLVCSSIENLGLGKLFEDFIKLKQELQTLGMFEDIYKQAVPEAPKKIGLITARGSQAEKDFIRNCNNRDAGVDICICYATMQGKTAAASVMRSLSVLEKEDVEVVAIARGGGSFEDLNCFNDRDLAYAIFNYSIPVVSAIGHEGDYTILDYVADLRVSTPTAAAARLTRDVTGMKKRLEDKYSALKRAVKHCTDLAGERLKLKYEKLNAHNPENVLEKRFDYLEHRREKLTVAIENLMRLKETEFKQKAIILDSLSPMKKLESGYSIVTFKDKVITHMNEVSIGDELQIDVSDGIIKAEVSGLESR